MQEFRFDADLVRRYGGAGPRYTSYPTALQFSEQFGAAEHRREARASNYADPVAPLSLYLHIPFCRSLCYYCGCTKIVTRNEDRVQAYLDDLKREIELQADLFTPERIARQLHLGGGTPTYLSTAQMVDLISHLDRHFNLLRDDRHEFSIEIDPRTISRASLSDLADLGFNRLSLGVQDFDPAVQAAVNREQSFAEVAGLADEARRQGFGSLSFDLIYGLPKQSLDSFTRTLRQVAAIRPERVAVYSYAHLPQRFKGQRMIQSHDLPSPSARLAILGRTLDILCSAGYEYIGMDHFALPDDELAQAQRDGTLQRNFQGYSTHGSSDLLGLGISAISHIGDSYSQNVTSTAVYAEHLAAGQLPAYRGLKMNADDRVRADVIQTLMCYDRIDFAAFGRRHGLRFENYFSAELNRLEPLQNDGLVSVATDHIQVTRRGRLLLRTIARVFDGYHAHDRESKAFSQTI